MIFSKKFVDKEVECRVCHKKVKPIIKKNKLKDNFYMERYLGMEKKYLMICPNCKTVIGAKS